MAADLEALFSDSPESSGMPGISHSSELQRVLSLPLRDPLPLADRLYIEVTRRLKTPEGTMTLYPLQALALVEAYEYRGLLALFPVGEGKTLLSYLLPLVLPVRRPLLIVPAALVEKTEVEFAELRAHWQYAPMQVTSYKMISTHPELLNELAPDCLICDEVHCLKDPTSAVTKRVWRYIRACAKAHKRLTFYGMSGTITARSFREWWHIQQWALLPELQPLPYQHPHMLSWCEALDEKIKVRRPVGALAAFSPEDPTPSGIRAAFGQRLRLVPSIIASEGSDIAASIEVRVTQYNVPAITDAVVELRRAWATPDEEFTEAADLWRHAREMGNGFYYKWRVPGPPAWMEARRAFNAFVRSVLHRSRTYDSMGQVKKAFPDSPEVATWAAIEHSFRPETVPVWFCEGVLQYAAAWAARTHGIVWVEHRAVGHRLEDNYGLPYYGELGRTRDGRRLIDLVDKDGGPGIPCVVSQKAGSQGFNLQYQWCENLILNMTPIGTQVEQLMGRTHRQGQRADTVRFEFLIAVAEQRSDFENLQRDSLYEQQITGQRQKLCLADVTNSGALAA